MSTIKARDLMTTDVLAVRDGMTLEEVARFLVEHEISGAPVIDSRGRLLGVVSLADLVRAGAEDERAGGPASREAIRRAPEAIGFDELEEPELAAEPSEEEPPDEELAEEEPRRVEDVMSTRVLTVEGSTGIDEIARMMLQARYHRVLVTEEGRLVGLVSSMDLVRLVADQVAVAG